MWKPFQSLPTGPSRCASFFFFFTLGGTLKVEKRGEEEVDKITPSTIDRVLLFPFFKIILGRSLG